VTPIVRGAVCPRGRDYPRRSKTPPSPRLGPPFWHGLSTPSLWRFGAVPWEVTCVLRRFRDSPSKVFPQDKPEVEAVLRALRGVRPGTTFAGSVVSQQTSNSVGEVVGVLPSQKGAPNPPAVHIYKRGGCALPTRGWMPGRRSPRTRTAAACRRTMLPEGLRE
jgi:hypothetical protein